MVQQTGYGKLRPESELPVKRQAAAAAAAAVKLEIEDRLEDEHGPLNKRSKMAPPPQQWETGDSVPPTEAIQYNLLNEPSPLGLRLRKSPSLLDLIQMRLSQANTTVNSCIIKNESLEDGKKKDTSSSVTLANTEKMKASNFPASLLRIGSWEYESRYEGDLVAKCYFAKRKLVWEILDGGLKSKIEIQWSDITAMKATCLDNGPGTLDIVLARQPLFFRETNPQPRKHTLWQATSDFTDGQASIHRRHFLQCPQGLLSKHFEKLIQCDPQLYALSLEPDIILENPFFEPRSSIFEDQEEYKCQPFDKLNDAYESAIHEFQNSPSACASTSTSVKNDIPDSVGALSGLSIGDIHAPRSVTQVNSGETEDTKNQNYWDQLKVPGLKPSMSISDFVNQLEHCISEQITAGNSQLSGTVVPGKEMLEELVQCLFSDSQLPASDEKSVMTKVNSFCSLLQKDIATVQSQQHNAGGSLSWDSGVKEQTPPVPKGESKDSLGSKAGGTISRKDSFGELLMHLPRISSLPQFLFNITEDEDDYLPSP
ncbi:hypothetical protein Cni_G26080 [Canna indica]|uniref:TRF2/HOY1 PH-like domain-containing protein n=1 Tax=Canna indica TaxID=4628 RepID=A0AAQ3KYZ6_9LILI|nr:hypothetical protein Cni_G26080 [Canna indica]